MQTRLKPYIDKLIRNETPIVGFRGAIEVNNLYADTNKYFHVRWFSNSIEKAIVQRYIQINKDETWLGNDERLFNTFGGADFKINIINATYSPDRTTANLTVELKIKDIYTFTADKYGLRLLYDTYKAGHMLERNGDLLFFRHSETLIFSINSIKTGIRLWK